MGPSEVDRLDPAGGPRDPRRHQPRGHVGADRASLRRTDEPVLGPAVRRVRLPEWGIGMTNLVARPSPGIDDLSPAEYLEGWTILEKKIERFRPAIVAFVGVTMYRALWRVLGGVQAGAPKPVIKPGFQRATVHGARLFVLPNPSGRNAHFSYDDMLRAFRALGRAMRALPAAGISARPSVPARAASSSAAPAAGAAGTSPRAAGRSSRTPPSSPAAGRSRRATRKRAGLRS
jgi:G:T/U-mismatch repair DNA glycosylase